MAFNWTDEHVEQLRSMWEKNSASQLAKHFGDGCTKNAVIGKAHRLGLLRKKEQVQTKKAAEPKSKKTPVVKPKKMGVVMNMKVDTCAIALAYKGPSRDGYPSGSLHEIREDGCRYIIDTPADDLAQYCGAKQEQKSYCLTHYRRLWYTPVQKVVRAPKFA